jgi:uncharacterized HhH-GPD family protein
VPSVTGTLYITGDTAADTLLNTEGTALLIGMLLDQQVPMEWAFAGPATLRERLGHLDAERISAMDVETFVSVCCEKPAIHRFPASMGRRIHEMCTELTASFGGKGANVWKGVTSGQELYDRLRTLAGYGEEKARIFVAILGKRMSVQPAGWVDAAGKFGDDNPRSVADITDETSLGKVREWKKAAKADKRDKQDRPLADPVKQSAPAKKPAAAKKSAPAKKSAAPAKSAPAKKSAAAAKSAPAKKSAAKKPAAGKPAAGQPATPAPRP